MRACVVVFPGSNADTEMIRTLKDTFGQAPEVIFHTQRELPEGVELVAIPGGFSYGDYLRCGAIAKVSPIINSIIRHAARGGYVLGVCNGFQILTEVGLLEGALTRNVRRRFDCHDVYVRVTADGPFTSAREVGAVLRLPIAHAEGRYQATAETLERLQGDGRIALQYCAPDGALNEAANPNGSTLNIAGIYGGPRRNVLGLMPHPERMSDPLLGGTDGRMFFESVRGLLNAA